MFEKNTSRGECERVVSASFIQQHLESYCIHS